MKKICLFFCLITFLIGCNSPTTVDSNSSNAATHAETPAKNPATKSNTTFSAPLKAEDTTDCLHILYHIIWKQSNFWGEFKKNKKNELYADITDNEVITYLNDVVGDTVTIQISANDAYIKRNKLNHGFHIVTMLTLDMGTNKLSYSIIDDSYPIKFDTTLLPLLRRKCMQHQSSF